MTSNMERVGPEIQGSTAPLELHRRAVLVLLSLVILLIVVLLAAVGIGMVPIAPQQVLGILFRHGLGLSGMSAELPWSATAQQEAVLLTIRVPRVILGALTGAGLAVSGAAMQGLFRNPLADPGLIGVSSGAA